MTAWTPAELDTIDRTGEVDVATRRADDTLRTPRIVWIVRHRDSERDAVYVRSVNGPTAAWYRGVQTRHAGRLTAGHLQRDVRFVEARVSHEADADLHDALDADYRDKYGRSSAVTHITAELARATTLRIDPA